MLHLFSFKQYYNTYMFKITVKYKFGGESMKSVSEFVSTKGKIIFIPALIVFVLISIFIFNGFQSSDTSIITVEGGTYIEASGMVENNAVSISSEVIGTINEIEVNEGDEVKTGQIIAMVNNTSISNQYDQSIISLELSKMNLELIEDNLKNFDSQNANSIEQARSAYKSVEGEYERVIEGASPEEIHQVEEAVNQAKINLDYLEANLNKSKELLENEVVSQSMYDEVELNYNLALAQFNTADSKLALIKSQPTDATIKSVQNKMLQAKAGHELVISSWNAQLQQLQNQFEIAKVQLEQAKIISDQLKVELDKTTIKSPIDGVINLLTIKQGEYTTPGKTIAEIYDLNGIEIKVYVSEENIGHVKVGQDVNIFVDSDSEQTFKGKVTRINNKAEFTPKNIQTKEERVNTVFEVKIQVLDSKGVIKSGMPADVNIRIN